MLQKKLLEPQVVKSSNELCKRENPANCVIVSDT